MSEILGFLDVNDYGLQSMVAGAGKMQDKTATPTTSQQIIEPDQGYDGMSSVTVNAVTSAIDENIIPTNIRSGKTILGVQGNLEPDKPDQNKTVTPSTVQQVVVADTGYELAQVTVEAVPDETPELNAQDTLLGNQEILIGQLGSALDDKIALDLQAATSDANATANDIAKNKTAYVNGVKLTGTLTGGLDIYVQTSAPLTYKGIWIKSNSYTYSAVKEIATDNLKEASTVNIVAGNTYSTDFGINLTYNFNKVLITDSNNDIQYDIEVYYGDGIQWVDITPLAPPTGTFAGIRVDFVNGTIEELEGSSSVDSLNCYSGRRRCNMQDDGTITAYYGDNNYDNVGSENLQVMVEQPKVYYSLQNVEVDSNGAINKADYIVADTKIDDNFDLHPAFISNNVEYDKVYVGAFEGTIVNNKLSSIGGGTSAPVGSITRNQARNYASNRGNIWRQLTKQYDDLESLLMTIELRSFNHQEALSYGVANSNTNQLVGQTYTLNAKGTGLKGANISASDCFTWRWRENKYGNICKWLDGININNGIWYIADNNFQDDTSSGYIQLNETASTSSGWIQKFAYVDNAKWIFMPKIQSSSKSGLTQDYHYYGSGWCAFAMGGTKSSRDEVGSFGLANSASSSTSLSIVGAGLIAMPTPTNL